MLYIVTYATHQQGYLETLKESCPDLVVLGYGTKWNGFRDKAMGVSEFCKTKNPDDLVCFVDGFDSVVLDKDVIEKRYRELDQKLVMSSDLTITYILHKYNSDKLFSKCKENGDRLNSGMYIGTPESIIELWSGFEDGGDDQTHATKKCKDVYIDSKSFIFYNYIREDSLKVRGGKLYREGQDAPIPVISAPVGENMNHILKEVGFENLPDIKKNEEHYTKSYRKLYLPERLLAFACIVLVLKLHNKVLALGISAILFLAVLNFEVYTKHKEESGPKRAMQFIGDAMYISSFPIILGLIANSKNIKNILILDALAVAILLLPNISLDTRIKYLVDAHVNYSDTGNPISDNKILITIIFLVNIWKLRNV
jgi:hypothetical protein